MCEVNGVKWRVLLLVVDSVYVCWGSGYVVVAKGCLRVDRNVIVCCGDVLVSNDMWSSDVWDHWCVLRLQLG